MSIIIETIVSSLRDLLGVAVKAIPNLLAGIIILFLTKYAVQLVQNLVEKAGSRAIRSLSLQLLLKKTTRVAIWVIGIVLACVVAFPGFKLGDVIATLGLGSVAVGFAFQDIFKNFLAGIILLVEEPFSIGDEIEIGDYQGKVENISIRTTQIRTYQGQKVLLPNSTVFADAVQVVTAYPARRTDLAVGVDYNTPLTEASQLLANLIVRVEGVLNDPPPEIDLVNFNDSSIDFVVRYWTHPQQKLVRHVQTRAIVAIKKAFDEADINIPYPIRTLYYYDQEKYNDYLPQEDSSSTSEV
ncbi:mechanosensitive ion channel family protein [Myxosarcina sp. GI1(2024)]